MTSTGKAGEIVSINIADKMASASLNAGMMGCSASYLRTHFLNFPKIGHL
jgi:hypothetical protein